MDGRPYDASPRQPGASAGSAEAAGDVGLGRLVVGVGEHLAGGVELHEVTGLAGGLEVEEAGVVGDAGGLLHVVGDDDDRVVRLQLVDQVLDGGGGDRVE